MGRTKERQHQLLDSVYPKKQFAEDPPEEPVHGTGSRSFRHRKRLPGGWHARLSTNLQPFIQPVGSLAILET